MAAGAEPDAFVRACPSRALLARVGEKWTMLAIVALKEGPMRFGGLIRRLDGFSQKMLTQSLRNLERDGLVSRQIFDEMPLRVEYSLTSSGADLLPHIAALKAWAEQTLFVVAKSNRAFDMRSASPSDPPSRPRLGQRRS